MYVVAQQSRMKPDNVHTARLFKSTRQRLGLSVRALAKLLKVPASKVSRIESGHLAPDLLLTQRLVEASGAENLETLFIHAYR